MTGTPIAANKFVTTPDPNLYIVDNPTATLFVFAPNGSVNDATALDGGNIQLFNGGTTNNTLVGPGGNFNVFGGTANGTEIASGGVETINTGANVQHNTVDGAGNLDIKGGGSSGANQVSGVEFVSSDNLGGLDTGSTILNHGALVIQTGGEADQETVTTAASIFVQSGGKLNGANVTGLGSTVFASGTGTSNVDVSAGGALIIAAGATSTNDIVGSGGSESVQGTEQSATIEGGTLTVQTGGSFNRVMFNDAGSPTTPSTLAIAGTIMPTGTISSFGPKDVIDLQNVAYDSQNGTATLSKTNQLTVSENGKSFVLQLDPTQNYAGDYFTLSADNASGTNVSLVQAGSSPPPSENVKLSNQEESFAGHVENSAVSPSSFAAVVKLIEGASRLYTQAVHAEAQDPLLNAAISDTTTGGAKQGEISNAALQLAHALSDQGYTKTLLTAAAITAGAVHEVETGNLSQNFIHHGLQQQTAMLFHSEQANRPF